MTVSYYIEDIFVEFIEICSHNGISMQSQDRSAAYGFIKTLFKETNLPKIKANMSLKYCSNIETS